MPYHEENPYSAIPKTPSQVRWEKKANHIQFVHDAPQEIQKRIISHLFPASAFFKNDAVAEKFLAMDPVEAARHMERAAILTQNPKTSMPAEIPFLLNKKQQQMLQVMNTHFADDTITSIPVTREGWLLIQSLPKKIKCEFKNEEEFYTAELMRDTTDQAVYVTSQAIQGGLKGALPGFVASYISQSASSLRQAGWGIASRAFEETNKSSRDNLGESWQQGLKDANDWLQQQTDPLEDPTNVKLNMVLRLLKGRVKR